MTKYTKDHEYVNLSGDLATVGITNHAQDALGDLVFVELPAIGRKVKAGEAIATVESVKAASDVYAPLSGEITKINQAIIDDPALVNRDPENAGWFFVIKLASPKDYDALLDEAAYKALI